MIKTSPMMEQWHQCKEQSKGALLLFRLGDFYEAFYDDAALLASELELTLTQRQGIPMSGIPSQTLDHYLDKLVKNGFLVAIAEQVEKPGESKGLLKREIVRIVSLATHITSTSSSEKTNHFFACLTQVNTTYGLALLDLYTGEMIAAEFENFSDLIDELHKYCPSELLLSKKLHTSHEGRIKEQLASRINLKEDWYFDHQIATDKLRTHFSIHSLETFGLSSMVSAINSAGSLLHYLIDDLGQSLSHVQKIRPENGNNYMAIGSTTVKHLELEKILDHLNFTTTPMGSRLLKNWVFHPLLSIENIAERQDAIAFFIEKNDISHSLSQVKDLERLVMKIKTGHINPKDLLALSSSLKQIPLIKDKLEKTSSTLLQNLKEKLVDLGEVVTKIEEAIVEDPPHRLSDGNVFRTGLSSELDEIRSFRQNSQTWLALYQAKLQNDLDIKTLKVSYTKAFGYYIEISRGQSNKVPPSFERRQTLINQERFVTSELREYEQKILHAEDVIQGIENKLFNEIVKEIARYGETIQSISANLAIIDALLSLALAAKKYNWTRPLLTNESTLEIIGGRHPIVENNLPPHTFIPNDTLLNDTQSKLILLTGPNMAGKSTYIRQVAVIVIMAQIGSFVPVHRAQIGIVDKVFSRIGASDDLSKGQSTFMVEMSETANILHNATKKSLVILDEIGRGTSTYDGISIAWAVAEYLLRPNCSPKTLFATHYTELTELDLEYKGVKNFCVAVHEAEEGIVFLHKIITGGADKSYGIHVAKLAGLPKDVLVRARTLLAELEEKHKPKVGVTKKKSKEKQLTFFDDYKEIEKEEILQSLVELDLNEVTPMQALTMLSEWKKRL